MNIFLFDIDGTMIRTSGCGICAMNRAFHNVFGLHEALTGFTICRLYRFKHRRSGLTPSWHH